MLGEDEDESFMTLAFSLGQAASLSERTHAVAHALQHISQRYPQAIHSEVPRRLVQLGIQMIKV